MAMRHIPVLLNEVLDHFKDVKIKVYDLLVIIIMLQVFQSLHEKVLSVSLLFNMSEF